MSLTRSSPRACEKQIAASRELRSERLGRQVAATHHDGLSTGPKTGVAEDVFRRLRRNVGAPCRTVSVSIGTVRYFTGFLSMRKPGSNKRSKARVRRPTTKTLAAPNDPVKRGARQPSPQTNGSLVGALFNSQVAVAQLMYQLSPLPMNTRQQAIMLDTFASAFNGALEAHDHAE